MLLRMLRASHAYACAFTREPSRQLALQGRSQAKSASPFDVLCERWKLGLSSKDKAQESGALELSRLHSDIVQREGVRDKRSSGLATVDALHRGAFGFLARLARRK